uniref:Uroplakin 3A n=1 Tax=Vombatus ursinus TaxID=29139 RepID=A0A4X2M211_VOMUR
MCPLWAVLALGWLPLSLAVDLEPQLASIVFATNNPTLTTIALEKPFCMFNVKEVSYEVNLYVMVNSVSTYLEIDTWPGRRSGAMIVITSILSTLVFILLLGFVAAVIFSFVSMGSSDLETQHESQISQEVVPKAQGTLEPSYSSVNRRQSLDQAEVYTSKLQD